MKAYKTIKSKKNMGHLPPFKTAVGRCPLQPAVAAGYSRATARRQGDIFEKKLYPHIFLINRKNNNIKIKKIQAGSQGLRRSATSSVVANIRQAGRQIGKLKDGQRRTRLTIKGNTCFSCQIKQMLGCSK